MSIGNVLLEKSIYVFSKHSGPKYNKRHTQKITPGHEKVLALQKPVRIFKKKQNKKKKKKKKRKKRNQNTNPR